MNKFIGALAVSVCMIGAGSAYAGNGHHKGGHHEHRGMQMFEQTLELTEQQKEQIREIHQAAREGGDGHKRGWGAKAVMALDPGAPDYREQVEQLAQESAAQLQQKIIERGEVQAEVYAILTPEQREKLKEIKNDKQKRHQQRAARKAQAQNQ